MGNLTSYLAVSGNSHVKCAEMESTPTKLDLLEENSPFETAELRTRY